MTSVSPNKTQHIHKTKQNKRQVRKQPTLKWMNSEFRESVLFTVILIIVSVFIFDHKIFVKDKKIKMTLSQ